MGSEATRRSADERLAGAWELLDAGTEYYTSVQTIIPLATISEALFTTFYNRLVRRDVNPPAQTYLLGFDSMPIRAEKSLYDLATWSQEHPGLARTLTGTRTERILDLLEAEALPPAWTQKSGASGGPAFSLTWIATGIPSQPGLREPGPRLRPTPSSTRSSSTSGAKDRTPTSVRGG